MKKSISFLTAFSISLFTFSALCSSHSNAETTEPTEIVSLRSEYGKQFDNGDGTITSYINTIPIHYWKNNELVEIDNSLIFDENEKYTNKCSSLNVTIPSKISKINSAPIDDSDIKLEYKGHNLYISLGTLLDENDYAEATIIERDKAIIARESIPREMEDSFEKVVSSVKYDSLRDDTNLLLDVRPDSLYESLVFDKGSVIPDTITYCVKIVDLSVKICDNNEIVFVDENGNTVFSFSKPLLTDSTYESISLPVNMRLR